MFAARVVSGLLGVGLVLAACASVVPTSSAPRNSTSAAPVSATTGAVALSTATHSTSTRRALVPAPVPQPAAWSEKERTLQAAPAWTLQTCIAFGELRGEQGSLLLDDTSPKAHCENSFTRRPDDSFEPSTDMVEWYADNLDLPKDVAAEQMRYEAKAGSAGGNIRLIAGGRLQTANFRRSADFGLDIKMTPGEPLPLVEQVAKKSGLPYTISYDALFAIDEYHDLIKRLTYEWRSDFPEINNVGINDLDLSLSILARADAARCLDIQRQITDQLAAWGVVVVVDEGSVTTEAGPLEIIGTPVTTGAPIPPTS